MNEKVEVLGVLEVVVDLLPKAFELEVESEKAGPLEVVLVLGVFSPKENPVDDVAAGVVVAVVLSCFCSVKVLPNFSG